MDDQGDLWDDGSAERFRPKRKRTRPPSRKALIKMYEYDPHDPEKQCPKMKCETCDRWWLQEFVKPWRPYKKWWSQVTVSAEGLMMCGLCRSDAKKYGQDFFRHYHPNNRRKNG